MKEGILPKKSKDATGLPRGESRLPAKESQPEDFQMPRACLVESHVCCYLVMSVNPPRRKAVASMNFFHREM